MRRRIAEKLRLAVEKVIEEGSADHQRIHSGAVVFDFDRAVAAVGSGGLENRHARSVADSRASRNAAAQ